MLEGLSSPEITAPVVKPPAQASIDKVLHSQKPDVPIVPNSTSLDLTKVSTPAEVRKTPEYYRTQLRGFLNLAGLRDAQLQTLSPEIRERIENFTPTDERTLDTEFRTILHSILENNKIELTPEQNIKLQETEIAVSERALTVDNILSEVERQTAGRQIPQEEKKVLTENLQTLKTDFEDMTKSPKKKAKSFLSFLDKSPVKWIGLAGLAALLLGLWRSVKGVFAGSSKGGG